MAELSNEDLQAVPESGRTWSTWNYAALWIGMSVCIPTYQLASSLIGKGMNWKQAVFTVLLGNLIVLVPMILNGHAGAKYGIPFPVFARAPFGVIGANVPAMLRALVACGWFGIQTWIGGKALAIVVEKIFWPGIADLPFLGDGVIHLKLGDFACFLLFWGVNMLIVWAGIDSIRKLLVLKSVFLPAATLALLLWAYSAANGFGPMLNQGSVFNNTGEFLAFFFPAVTGMVGFWATLSLNIPDFTRYARGQKEQMMGQALGLPTSMAAVAFVGVAVTSATLVLPEFHGKAEWDPVVVVNKSFHQNWLVAVAMFCVTLSTLATNIAANIVSPANDFSNLNPRAISFRTGGYITGVVGILMCPWKLVEDPTGYIFTWLIGYSALLGPIGGILITDYFLIRRTSLDVKDLYSHTGRYSYKNGWNHAALIALALGILPNIPGFIAQVRPTTPVDHLPAFLAVIAVAIARIWHLVYDLGPQLWTMVYSFAWFVGFGISGAVYYVLMLRTPPTPVEAK